MRKTIPPAAECMEKRGWREAEREHEQNIDKAGKRHASLSPVREERERERDSVRGQKEIRLTIPPPTHAAAYRGREIRVREKKTWQRQRAERSSPIDFPSIYSLKAHIRSHSHSQQSDRHSHTSAIDVGKKRKKKRKKHHNGHGHTFLNFLFPTFFPRTTLLPVPDKFTLPATSQEAGGEGEVTESGKTCFTVRDIQTW